jgi:flagellar biosynthetic protein FlhB
MAEQDESAEKSHEATPRKLEQARKKGDIPRAPDLLTAAGYLGLLLCGVTIGAESLKAFASVLMPLISQPDRLVDVFFNDGAPAPVGQLMTLSMKAVIALLVVPGLLVLLTLLATRGIVFAPSKLVPKLQRLSVLENAKNKYGRRGLFEFLKSFVKLSVYSICLALFLRSQSSDILGVVRASPAEAVQMMVSKMMQFLTLVVVIAGAIGLLDFFWQRAEFMRRNRMTLKEMRDEFKESEGDPHFKNQRRSRAQEIALNQMMGEVPTADVIIVNPTHYAVALKWSRMPGSAPVCVAKGVDEIALKIRELAQENEIPIQSDPPTARALFAATEIGDEISPDHYAPVAAAIRFADEMRAKARKTRWK